MFVLERKMYFPEKMVEKLLFLLPRPPSSGGPAPEKMAQVMQQGRKHRNKIKQARKVRDFPDLFLLKKYAFINPYKDNIFHAIYCQIPEKFPAGLCKKPNTEKNTLNFRQLQPAEFFFVKERF